MTLSPSAHAESTPACHLRGLAEILAGAIILPASPAFSSAIAALRLPSTAEPLAIIRAAGPADVVHAVRFARANHLPFALAGTDGATPARIPSGALVIEFASAVVREREYSRAPIAPRPRRVPAPSVGQWRRGALPIAG